MSSKKSYSPTPRIVRQVRIAKAKPIATLMASLMALLMA